MSKLRFIHKVVPVFLIISILFTACDVPDISEFTTQSAEMTRGIRKGVKDTEALIKTASDRDDLYSEPTRKEIKKQLKKYQTAVKPTLNALDGLDGYLGALNALSQANKKSEENSKAVVNSVSSLVTAVSGFTFASEVINVASGVLTLAEQFRTARSFKKRVNLASEIVEGRQIEKTEDFTINGEVKQRTVIIKTCDEKAGDRIVTLSRNAQKIINPILESLSDKEKKELAELPADQQLQRLRAMKRVNDEEMAILKTLSPEEKRKKLVEWGRLSSEQNGVIVATEMTINAFGCGVIDFLKFNIMDLKVINEAVSQSIIDNIKDKNATVIKLDDKIDVRRKDIRNNLDSNQDVINLITRINEYVAVGTSSALILDRKVRLKTNLDDAFTRDSVVKDAIIQGIRDCGADCGATLEALNMQTPLDCDANCVNGLKEIFRNRINQAQFDKSTAIIIKVLNVRNGELDDEDKKLKNRIELLTPDLNSVTADYKSFERKRNDLDALFNTSLSALDTWAETHANLRVAVNTKQPLSVSKLVSKVREIWEIVNPSES